MEYSLLQQPQDHKDDSNADENGEEDNEPADAL